MTLWFAKNKTESFPKTKADTAKEEQEKEAHLFLRRIISSGVVIWLKPSTVPRYANKLIYNIIKFHYSQTR